MFFLFVGRDVLSLSEHRLRGGKFLFPQSEMPNSSIPQETVPAGCGFEPVPTALAVIRSIVLYLTTHTHHSTFRFSPLMNFMKT